ncbi:MULTISPECIES: CHC2 zinc finger domain-containing protein [Sphingomonas]|uniref:CHC2 zinc finger domain-containing protein n=1 Tax=Sphingomonas TaxID=13687 RepID=UPI00082B2F8C|nr:CHC2 zinc finger domain-containing protein [Sphingomonas pituitosa]
MAYRRTLPGDALALEMPDGTVRQVLFAGARAVADALTPGRQFLDAIAISWGLLPLGSTFVSEASTPAETWDPGASKRVSGIAFGFAALGSEVELAAIHSSRDDEARRLAPLAAERYKRLARALRSPEGSQPHLRDALLVDVLKGQPEARGEDVVRAACSLHPDAARGFYLHDRARHFQCFSCGACGSEVDWLKAKYGLSREQATSLLAG